MSAYEVPAVACCTFFCLRWILGFWFVPFLFGDGRLAGGHLLRRPGVSCSAGFHPGWCLGQIFAYMRFWINLVSSNVGVLTSADRLAARLRLPNGGLLVPLVGLP